MEQTKKESVITRVFHIAAQGKGPLWMSCFLSAAGMLAGTIPYLSVYMIARQLLMPPAASDTSSAVITWAIVAGISIVLNMLLTFCGSYGCHKAAFELLYHFRLQVMEHIGKLPISFFADHTTGSVQKTMDDNIEKIEGFVAHMLPDIIGSALITVTLFGSLFLLNGLLSLTVLLTILAALYLQKRIFGGEQARQLWMDTAAAAASMTGAFSEYVKGIAEVKLFGLTGTVTRSLEDSINHHRMWELRQYKRSALPMSAYKTLILSLLTFVLPVGIMLIRQNPTKETLLAVLMALILTPAIYDPLMICVNYGAQMGMLAVGLDAIDQILAVAPISTPDHPATPHSWEVTFEDVSFSYQDPAAASARAALSEISFTAPQGQMTALVGPSGGGKSTIGNLVNRFWDVNSGRIKIGGVDIRQIDPRVLMDYVAVVFQDTYLFSGTILDNITMNRSCQPEQIEAAAKAAQCHNFIAQLPDGYQTRIGSDGVRLSGGEAQRLSIARAILKDSPIVVLDEALAYSDAKNENLIQTAIHNLVRNKTVIIIAHRLQSIQKADQILVLKDGRIIDRGTHQILMNHDGEYRQLWQLQHQAEFWSIKTAAIPANSDEPGKEVLA